MQSPTLGRNAAGSPVRGSRSQAAPRAFAFHSRASAVKLVRPAPRHLHTPGSKEACNFLFKIFGQGLRPVLPKPRRVDGVLKLSL